MMAEIFRNNVCISGIYLLNKNYNTENINFYTLNTFLEHRGPDNSNNWINDGQNLFFS